MDNFPQLAIARIKISEMLVREDQRDENWICIRRDLVGKNHAAAAGASFIGPSVERRSREGEITDRSPPIAFRRHKTVKDLKAGPVGVYPENYAAGAAWASSRGHPVEFGPHQGKRAARTAYHDTAEVKKYPILGSIRVYREKHAVGVVRTPTCSHPVELIPHECEGPGWIISIVRITAEICVVPYTRFRPCSAKKSRRDRFRHRKFLRSLR